MIIHFTKARNPNKKWMVLIDGRKYIEFGHKGSEDYTMHKDPQRKKNYIQRHQARENWGKSGIYTAGFWSRWALWNLPDLIASLEDIERRFNVTIDLSFF